MTKPRAFRPACPLVAVLAFAATAPTLDPGPIFAQPAAPPAARSDAGAAAPAPAPTPPPPSAKPSTTPGGNGAAPGIAPSIDRLRAEHAAVKDALFRSRARRETLENALLATKLAAVLTWEGSRRHQLKSAELRLDGVRLWDSAESPLGERPVTLAPRGIPAGTHVLGIRVEVRARDNPKLGYVSEQTFTIVLPEGKKTTVEITVDEDGDLPGYNPDVDVEIDVSDK
jgi:hypothetical protein